MNFNFQFGDFYGVTNSFDIKDILLTLLAILIFYITNWWNSAEKFNDELKIFDLRCQYLKSILVLSIDELKSIKEYYCETVEFSRMNQGILPSPNYINLTSIKTFVSLNKIDEYFGMFKVINKEKNNTDDINVLVSYFNSTIEYNNILRENYNDLNKIFLEENVQINERIKSVATILEKYKSTNVNIQKIYSFCFTNRNFKTDLNFFIVNLYEEIVKTHSYDLLNLEEKLVVKQGYDFCKSKYYFKIDRINDLYKNIDKESQIIDKTILLLEENYRNFISNYEKYSKPYLGDDFIKKYRAFKGSKIVTIILTTYLLLIILSCFFS